MPVVPWPPGLRYVRPEAFRPQKGLMSCRNELEDENCASSGSHVILVRGLQVGVTLGRVLHHLHLALEHLGATRVMGGVPRAALRTPRECEGHRARGCVQEATSIKLAKVREALGGLQGERG
jgi:hypothetical protein